MLRPRASSTAIAEPIPEGWHLQIPAGGSGNYRLAQVDNYSSLARRKFPINSSASLGLLARASSSTASGTWGFGFWNDPFAFSAGFQGYPARLPTLPNCCWFFNASNENHLSFRPNNPANGFLAQVFRSPNTPAIFFLPGLLAVPLLYAKFFSRWIRDIAGRLIAEDSTQLNNIDVTQWHRYGLTWSPQTVVFTVDGSTVFQTPTSPHGPLGAVIWIDNQFAAWLPDGVIKTGVLSNPNPEWLEVKQIEINT